MCVCVCERGCVCFRLSVSERESVCEREHIMCMQCMNGVCVKRERESECFVRLLVYLVVSER